MQIAKQFDPETIRKIWKSAEIASAGFLAGAVPLFILEMKDFILSGDPIDYRIPVAAGITAVGAWLYNTIQQWLKGKTDIPLE